jgi:hypothetical protein
VANNQVIAEREADVQGGDDQDVEHVAHLDQLRQEDQKKKKPDLEDD